MGHKYKFCVGKGEKEEAVYDGVNSMEVTFVGICSIDIYSKCARLPHLGETMHGEAHSSGFGGKAANACAQFTLLSPKTPPTLLTRVGDDSDGRKIIEHYQKAGISVNFIKKSTDCPTGLALCFVLERGESAIVIHPCPLTIPIINEYSQQLMQSRFVVTNFEIEQEVAKEALRIAKSGDSTTILTPAPCVPNVDDELLALVDIIVLNQHELLELGDSKRLFQAGVNAVVVTLGADGARVMRQGVEDVHVESPKVEAIDSTGAGDSFLGTFVYCLSRGADIIESTRIGCVAASASCLTIGTQNSYIGRDHPSISQLVAKYSP